MFGVAAGCGRRGLFCKGMCAEGQLKGVIEEWHSFGGPELRMQCVPVVHSSRSKCVLVIEGVEIITVKVA